MTTEDRTAADNRPPMGEEDVADWSRTDDDGELDEQRRAVDTDYVDEARRVDLERDRADGLDATDDRQDAIGEHPDAFQPSGEESHDVELAGVDGSVDEAEQVDLDEVSGIESPRQPMDDAADAEPSPLFDDGELDEFRARWAELQGAFVDDPKVAVEEADELVNDLVQTLTDKFSRNKHELEGQWQRDGSADTEDLRLALRRYRSFFDQLLRA